MIELKNIISGCILNIDRFKTNSEKNHSHKECYQLLTADKLEKLLNWKKNILIVLLGVFKVFIIS